ncbi:MAG TPA: hypothetical protein VKU19_33935 [Bryobacteraceae bacterium]|nr:hypothetical protein [Bryobacteraceae bacterium]
MQRHLWIAGPLFLAVSIMPAQPRAGAKTDPESKPFKSQSTSSISYTGGKEGERSVEITNITYDTTGDSVPGRPPGTHLVLRTTVKQKIDVGDKGFEGTVGVEAWPLGVDLQQKPLYSLSVPAASVQITDNILLMDRSLDGNASWWSIYTLGTGRHLFDTYADLLRFQVSREDGTSRFAGLDVPPDNTPDARLKEPHTVAVLSYASDEKVIREVLISCSDPKRAALLRSYDDVTRKLSVVDRPGARELRIVFEQNYPSTPDNTVVSIPIVKDDLDPAHAQLPAGIRAVIWKR